MRRMHDTVDWKDISLRRFCHFKVSHGTFKLFANYNKFVARLQVKYIYGINFNKGNTLQFAGLTQNTFV